MTSKICALNYVQVGAITYTALVLLYSANYSPATHSPTYLRVVHSSKLINSIKFVKYSMNNCQYPSVQGEFAYLEYRDTTHPSF